jgi:hypothetical protein
MAIVTRYFSTTAAGAGDGTTWADRAALFSSGNWSSVITGFNFSGSDSLECRIEGGLTYTCSQAMASSLFANPPSHANLIFFHGCDSSGALLDPPDPDWVSSQPPFSTSTLPTIATTGGNQTSTLSNAFWRLISFTASGQLYSPALANGNFNWIGLSKGGNFTDNAGISSPTLLTNSFITFTGNAFDYGISLPIKVNNVRINGSAATSSGNRVGLTTPTAGHIVSRFTVIGCAGGGIFAAAGSATRSSYYSQCLVVNCSTYGIRCNGTASQTVWHTITNCYVSGTASGHGIDANGARVIASNNRLRDNTSGNFTGMGNYPESYNYITDSDDATEFVNAAGGDYRIKNTAAIWGKGYGPGDEPAAGGGGGFWVSQPANILR